MSARFSADGRPAGFWRRLVAVLVDFMLFGAVRVSLAVVAAGVWGGDVEDTPVFQSSIAAFTFVFTALYTSILHAAGGQTLGKMLVGVRVMGTDGELLTFGAALLRYFAYYASLLPLGAGFVMAGLRRDKRALHDLLAGSRVERVVVRRSRVPISAERYAPPA